MHERWKNLPRPSRINQPAEKKPQRILRYTETPFPGKIIRKTLIPKKEQFSSMSAKILLKNTRQVSSITRANASLLALNADMGMKC
ncbi:hypothetical protein TNCV_2867671 [Trichonephila clavipes]|nr:hypothetical protein TNCV_2867671 [Trichonephila clavipes]